MSVQFELDDRRSLFLQNDISGSSISMTSKQEGVFYKVLNNRNWRGIKSAGVIWRTGPGLACPISLSSVSQTVLRRVREPLPPWNGFVWIGRFNDDASMNPCFEALSTCSRIWCRTLLVRIVCITRSNLQSTSVNRIGVVINGRHIRG